MSGEEEILTLRTVIDVQNAINEAGGSANDVMRIVVDQALTTITHATGAVVELSEDEAMVYTVTGGTLAGTEGLRLGRVGSLSGLCVTSGEVLVAHDTEVDPRVDREACRRVSARSMVAVPLIHPHGVAGVLKVVSDRPDAFDAHDIDLLGRLAAFIATALSRAVDMDDRTHAAITDELTGLTNRSAFLEYLRRAIAEVARGTAVVAVLFLDLDGFKPINDTHGHLVGDEVLREVGQRMASTCRAGDVAARIGGDEFAVLAKSPAASDLHAMRARLQAALAEPIPTQAGQLSVGVSCGLAVVSGQDLAESVLARADAAMYADKRGRKAQRSTGSEG